MKKMSPWIVPVVVLAVVCSFAPQAFAGPVNDAAQKFARGFTHFVTAPFHIPKQMIQITVETEPTYIAPWKGVTMGVGKGLFMMGRQWISAVADIVTCYKPGEPMYPAETLFPEL